MLSILVLIVFGFIVGLIAKLIHPGDEPAGCLPTIAIGVGGSFVGGLINWVLGMGNQPFHTSGILMSIIGGVICCAGWRWYSLKNSPTGAKNFFTGKKI